MLRIDIIYVRVEALCHVGAGRPPPVRQGGQRREAARPRLEGRRGRARKTMPSIQELHRMPEEEAISSGKVVIPIHTLRRGLI